MLLPAQPDGSSSEDPEARNDWFLFQRAYPFDSLPPDARQKAWESRPKPEREEQQLEDSIQAAATRDWLPVGPAPTTPAYWRNWGTTSGRVNAIAVSPSDSRLLLIGSSTGGIWRSTDSGASFEPVSDEQVDLAVGSIAFSKSNPAIVYAGMGDTKLGYLGSGVLKSTNSGQSWTRVSNNTLPAPGTISKLVIDPANPARLYVTQFSRLSGERVTSSGFYLSTDGGVNWSRTLAGFARDVVIDPANAQNLFVGMASRKVESEGVTASPGIYRSTDRGNSWSQVLTSPYDQQQTRDVRIAIKQSSQQVIYAYMGGFFGDHLDVRLLVSNDGGNNWTNRGTPAIDTAQFAYNTFITADPASRETLYIGSRDLFKSTDGGTRWENLTKNFNDYGFGYDYTPGISTAHADQHALAFSPANPNHLYLANDGGVSRSLDGGASFQSINATLSLTQFIGIQVHPVDPTITYGGTQDNGTQRRSSSSDDWYEIAIGDGGHCVIDPLNPATVFVTYIRGNVYRFHEDGNLYDRQVAFSDTFLESVIDPRMAFYPPFTGNGVDSTLYFGTWRLFISRASGDSWFAPAGDIDLTKGVNAKGRDVLTTIGVGRSNTNVIYTGSAQGRAMVSTDGGQSWSDRTGGLPDRFITSVTPDHTDAAVAYLTVSGYGSGHVFKTTDTGATWSDVSGNLPNIPTNDLILDPLNPKIIYAGTDIGIFRSTEGGTNWKEFNKGMPPAIVISFTSQPTGLIQAATYGRGAYELAGSGGRGEPPSIASAAFDGKKLLTITGSRLDTSQVLINDKDQSARVKSSSGSSITLKGKGKKFGLVPGQNTIQIIDSNNTASNVFILRL